MENAINKKAKVINRDECASTIQNAIRKRQNRVRFKKSLYKLMIVKNSIKEKIKADERRVRKCFDIWA